MTSRDFRAASARWFRGVRAMRQRADEIDAVAHHVAGERAKRVPKAEHRRIYRDELRFMREQCPPLEAAREEAAADRILGRRTVGG